jgi:glycosyltransferase involved in cell wall biosynthesis
MSILFIHPPLRRISGGSLYNRHIIQRAFANRYPLVSVQLTDIQLRTESAARIDRLKPRIVIWDSLFFDFVASRAPSSSACTSVLLVHYLPSLSPSLDPIASAKFENLEVQAIRNCDRIICTGSNIFRMLSGRHPEKPIFLCRPGVDEFFQPVTATPAPRHEHGVELISVANLLPDKGYLEMLEALSNLKAHHWTWHIVGSARTDRSFSKRFRTAAGAAGLMPRIRLHGILGQKRLAALLSNMDFFVNASRHESYGMATAEAVAAGLPVISTQTGAAAELIDDGDSGLIVPVGKPAALQHALHELLRSPELRNRFRAASRGRPRSSWQSCFDDFRLACAAGP